MASQSALRVESVFSGFDELTKTRSPEPGVAGSDPATTFVYDAHGNTTQLTENLKENTGGTQTAAGRVFTYCYDQLDRVTVQTDDFATPTGISCAGASGATDDERVTWTYTPTGLTDTRTLFKGTGSAWTAEQKQQNTYFDDGSLKQRSNYDGANTLIEQHTVSYLDGTVYMNGNRVSDVFKLKAADGGTTCWSATCTASWLYDARDRLVVDSPGTGPATVFGLDAIGNAANEGTTTRTFAGQKLVSQTAGATTTRFLYDGLGNVDCTTVGAYVGSTCPVGSSGSLLEDYTYDYKNRLVGYARWSGTSNTDTTSYALDALDRPVSQVETHAAATTTTTFRYLGDTNAVTQDTLSGATATTKKYAYGADGERITVTDGTARLSYLYDPHGSVSLLVDQANAVKASYGYTAYGSANAALSKTAGGFTDRNPYRYTGKRFDTGSNTYDMGARRYSPATGRWLQQDLYFDALDNLGLSRTRSTPTVTRSPAPTPSTTLKLTGTCRCARTAGHSVRRAVSAPVLPSPRRPRHHRRPSPGVLAGSTLHRHHQAQSAVPVKALAGQARDRRQSWGSGATSIRSADKMG